MPGCRSMSDVSRPPRIWRTPSAMRCGTGRGLTAYLDDGRIEMDTNVVERVIRPITITRKNALFAGNDGGARHWAIAMTLIQSAKLNGVEPMAYLTDVLERIVSGRTKASALEALLPWNWKASRSPATTAAQAA